jgi:hypothetical protein
MDFIEKMTKYLFHSIKVTYVLSQFVQYQTGMLLHTARISKQSNLRCDVCALATLIRLLPVPGYLTAFILILILLMTNVCFNMKWTAASFALRYT